MCLNVTGAVWHSLCHIGHSRSCTIGGRNLSRATSALSCGRRDTQLFVYSSQPIGALRMMFCSFNKLFMLINSYIPQLWPNIKGSPRGNVTQKHSLPTVVGTLIEKLTLRLFSPNEGFQTSLCYRAMTQVEISQLTDTDVDFTQCKTFQVENKEHVTTNITYGNACGIVFP